MRKETMEENCKILRTYISDLFEGFSTVMKEIVAYILEFPALNQILVFVGSETPMGFK